MRGAVGAEFPERGAISLRGSIGRQTGKFAGARVFRVVVPVDVPGDEVEEVVCANRVGAKTQAGGEAGFETERVTDPIALSVELQVRADGAVIDLKSAI